MRLLRLQSDFIVSSTANQVTVRIHTGSFILSLHDYIGQCLRLVTLPLFAQALTGNLLSISASTEPPDPFQPHQTEAKPFQSHQNKNTRRVVRLSRHSLSPVRITHQNLTTTPPTLRHRAPASSHPSILLTHLFRSPPIDAATTTRNSNRGVHTLPP